MYICLYMNHIKHNTRQRNYEDIVYIIYKIYIYITYYIFYKINLNI